MPRCNFSYPMLVNRGYVHGAAQYPILRTLEKDGELFVFFQAEVNDKTRIYVGICVRSVVIVHKTEVVLAKLAKQQDLNDYQTIVIGRPTRVKSKAKLQCSNSADRLGERKDYSKEDYYIPNIITRIKMLETKDNDLAEFEENSLKLNKDGFIRYMKDCIKKWENSKNEKRKEMSILMREHLKELMEREAIEEKEVTLDVRETATIERSFNVGDKRLEIA